ncbi:uncharacterized protein N7484_000287 [Penicillium longicatenatum]|uniref:uncharacterized protein n=1 Tax=Penicillium longicatenatum TaxID=1561947 RepID=UPI002546A2CA|nr:uncharacterized protein N7484_000287 [Penicillium longicatenatum]KAJ5660915.1 hypothetical protein N7484_000287 [Penicillium longicatenatum]
MSKHCDAKVNGRSVTLRNILSIALSGEEAKESINLLGAATVNLYKECQSTERPQTPNIPGPSQNSQHISVIVDFSGIEAHINITIS